MSTNENDMIENDMMQNTLSLVDRATKLVSYAQHARAMDDFIMGVVLSLFGELAKAPMSETLRQMLKQMAQDAATQMLEEDSFSRYEAAKPAHHLLQALDTIERSGAELQRWAKDDRFKPQKPSKTPTGALKEWLWPQTQPDIRLPVAEIVEQLAYVMGLLTMAGREAQLASEIVVRVRDPRTHLASDHTPPNLSHIEPPGYLIPLPTSQYRSQGDKGRDVLLYLEQFGDFLDRTAKRGRDRIYSASNDNEAFSPSVVAAEAIAVSVIVTNGLATCDALALLVWKFIEDSVATNSPRQYKRDETPRQYERGDLLEAEVIDHNKGGLIVNLEGIRGFVPISQILNLKREDTADNAETQTKLQNMVGRKLQLKIIEINRNRNRLILSERLAVQEWRAKRREELLNELQVGEVRKGVVSNLSNFGAFVDLGGADGLVHISQLAWSRVNHPSEVLKVGQDVEVQVLSVDKEKKKIALSIKRAEIDPWTTVEQRYQIGQVVKGTVTKIAPFGAFARIEDGVEGLIHLSELPAGQQDPKAVLKEGQEVNVRILRIDPERRRLGLSIRQVEQTAEALSWDEVEAEAVTDTDTVTDTSILNFEVASILAQPQMMLILWSLEHRLFLTENDFEQHFGEQFRTIDVVDRLVRLGLVDRHVPQLRLTDLGRLLVSGLRDDIGMAGFAPEPAEGSWPELMTTAMDATIAAAQRDQADEAPASAVAEQSEVETPVEALEPPVSDAVAEAESQPTVEMAEPDTSAEEARAAAAAADLDWSESEVSEEAYTLNTPVEIAEDVATNTPAETGERSESKN